MSDMRPEITSEDKRFMRRALQLAKRSRTHPNPMVGAVVVRDGHIVGEGWHKGKVDGVSTPHAEAMAFANAGEATQGATLYVTLEPCSFTGGGRTPCSQRCLNAGIVRVVCAMVDPDERVAGQGIGQLQTAGVLVTVGVEADKARALNFAYIKQRKTGLPYITHKAAMTLDGKIATASGDSKWITSPEARGFTHRTLRNRVDAIIVGIGTVLADNPALTTRLPRGNGHDPVRVLIDSRLRLPVNAQLTRSGTIVVVAEGLFNPLKKNEVEATGAEIVVVPVAETGHIPIEVVARMLADRGFYDVLLEGGGGVAAAFWEAKLVDRIFYVVAPKVIGGSQSITPVEGAGLSLSMADARRIGRLRVRRIGSDVALEGEVEESGYVYRNY